MILPCLHSPGYKICHFMNAHCDHANHKTTRLKGELTSTDSVQTASLLVGRACLAAVNHLYIFVRWIKDSLCTVPASGITVRPAQTMA